MSGLDVEDPEAPVHEPLTGRCHLARRFAQRPRRVARDAAIRLPNLAGGEPVARAAFDPSFECKLSSNPHGIANLLHHI